MLWLAGTVVGVLVGLMLPGEKWEEVDLRSVIPSFEATGNHGGHLQLGFRF